MSIDFSLENQLRDTKEKLNKLNLDEDVLKAIEILLEHNKKSCRIVHDEIVSSLS